MPGCVARDALGDSELDIAVTDVTVNIRDPLAFLDAIISRVRP